MKEDKEEEEEERARTKYKSALKTEAGRAGKREREPAWSGF